MATDRDADRGPDVAQLASGVIAGDRALLARSITLVESTLPRHQAAAQELINRLLPRTGGAVRVGVSGLPGAGKSTLIDALGTRLTARGHRVAVLAVDPSSARTRGSILGDKTRMERLAGDPAAFIRPSPSAGSLGGVSRRTRETMLLCEAAGFDVVLVETVGVGQSETHVEGMVDFFLVVMIAGGGDELQGIKRGILELADTIAINKADGANQAAARLAREEYAAALRMMTPRGMRWRPQVVTCSAASGAGLDELWRIVLDHRRIAEESGELARRRRNQRLEWMWSVIDRRLLESLRRHPRVRETLAELERRVLEEEVSPTWAADRLLEAYGLDGGAERR